VTHGLAVSAPLLYAFLHLGSCRHAVFPLGFTVMASFSVTMVMMHEIMSRHIGMASGIMIGFALGIGGVGVMITGLIADSFSIGTAFHFLVIILVLAGILTRFVPVAKS
jgi:FSR family fosmidomycin resistance protein-like MFS transporter